MSDQAPLFDHHYVYPSDSIGPYQDLSGEVVSTSGADFEGRECSVMVETDKGVFTGVWSLADRCIPSVGDHATVRVYNSGGGWYPEDRIIGWRSKNCPEK